MPRLATCPAPTDRPDAGGRILLIDDDELIAGALRRYLELRGSDCDVASNAAFAARFMASRNYSIIVVDPYLTGSLGEAPAALLATLPRLQPHAAVMILTGYPSSRLSLPGRSSSPAVILTKPQPVTAIARFIVQMQSPSSHGVVSCWPPSFSEQTAPAGSTT